MWVIYPGNIDSPRAHAILFSMFHTKISRIHQELTLAAQLGPRRMLLKLQERERVRQRRQNSVVPRHFFHAGTRAPPEYHQARTNPLFLWRYQSAQKMRLTQNFCFQG